MISIRWREYNALSFETVMFASDTAAMDWLIVNQAKISTMTIERYA